MPPIRVGIDLTCLSRHFIFRVLSASRAEFVFIFGRHPRSGSLLFSAMTMLDITLLFRDFLPIFDSRQGLNTENRR